MRIKDNYDSHTKDELLSEIGARGITSVSGNANKADLVAALELNDEETAAAKPKDPLAKTTAHGVPPVPVAPPPGHPKNLPFVQPAANIPAARAPGDAPPDADYSGTYTKRKGDCLGEQFALAIVEPDYAVNQKTHWAKNSAHLWNGTEDEFREQFDK